MGHHPKIDSKVVQFLSSLVIEWLNAFLSVLEMSKDPAMSSRKRSILLSFQRRNKGRQCFSTFDGEARCSHENGSSD